MIYGVGVDIMHLSQLESLVNNAGYDDPFFRRAFTLKERKQALAKDRTLVSFANRLAGKEAVYKAINKGEFGFNPEEIEILELIHGAVEVNLLGKTATAIEEQRIKPTIHLSLSNDLGIVIAQAVVEVIS